MFPALALLLLLSASSAALAAQADNYGLETMSTARASAVLNEPANPFAAVLNPGLLAAGDRSQFGFSTSQAGARFEPLANVRLPAPGATRANGPTVPGTLAVPEYRATLWAVGFSHPFDLPFWRNHRAGFGTALSGPFGTLRRFSAGAPSDVYALRYGTADHQFKGTVSLGLELVPRHLFLGTGVSLFITGAGDADGTIVAADPSARLAFDVGLNTSLVTGLYGRWNDTGLALVYHQAADPQFSQRFVGRVQLGATDIVSQPILLQSSLYYEPHTLEAEVQQDFRWGKVAAGLAYQHWKDYRPSYLVVQAVDAEGVTRVAQLPQVGFRGTWNPRLSLEVPIGGIVTAAAGYQYRPSAITDLSGGGNILDADTHVFALGLSHRFPVSPAFPWALTVGLAAQYHRLVEREVTKTSPDAVGAPRYRISGSGFTYGLSVQAEL